MVRLPAESPVRKSQGEFEDEADADGLRGCRCCSAVDDASAPCWQDNAVCVNWFFCKLRIHRKQSVLLLAAGCKSGLQACMHSLVCARAWLCFDTVP